MKYLSIVSIISLLIFQSEGCHNKTSNPVSSSNSSGWVKTNGPYGGRVLSFAVSGANLSAGTDDGGVFVSTNNGMSWIATGLTNTSVWSLAFSSGGTGDTNLFAGTSGAGVFLSTNSGMSWAATSLPAYVYVFCLAISPNGRGSANLFAGTSGGGVFLSTNNGVTWTAVNTGLTETWVTSLAVSGTNLFAGTDSGGVFLSTNNGTSWTESNTGLSADGFVQSFAIFPNGTGDTSVFAGTDSAGVFLSTDNGRSWVNRGLINIRIWSLAVSPNGTGGASLFAGTSKGVFLSTNNGASWTSVNTGLADTVVYSLAISGDKNLFAATDHGVWRRPLSEMITAVTVRATSVPSRFGLQQECLNPFNPSTVMSYQLPSDASVALKVYHVLGKEVETLANGHENAGNHSVKFDATDLPNGVCFYRLQAEA